MLRTSLLAALLPAAHVLADLSCSQATDLVNDLAVRPQQSTISQYCSDLLQLSTVITTTTAMVTPAVATTTKTITTPSPSATTTTTSTSVSVFSTTITSTSTSMVSVTSTTMISCATAGGVLSAQPSTTVVNNNNKKRATQAPLNPAPTVALSKMCSCMITAPTSTVTVSSTLSQSTSTSTVTSYSGPQGTMTVTSTVTTSSTTTIRSTKSVTATAYYTQPTISTFAGLTYYAYPMNYSFYLADPGWDVTTFYTSRQPNPLATGKVQKLQDIHSTGGAPYSCANLPGQAQATACEYVAIKMQGFFVAPSAGTWTLSTGNDVDNYLGMWSGNNAYTFTNNNADWQAKRAGDDRSQDRGGSKSFVGLQKGEMVPVTFIWMNGGGPGLFSFSVGTPDGTSRSDTSGYFVPACSSGNPFVN